MRGRGARCGFCGRPATVVALVAGGSSDQAAICPSCVARLAAGLSGPGDGGSAA
ncbi:MAG: ClpX C4-type zinc finger protein [Candidatus Dormibacteria bacterium]